MKYYNKKLINTLRGIGKFILLVSIWLTIGIVSAIISVSLSIPIDIVLQLEIGIALIVVAVINIRLIRAMPKNLIVYILFCLGIISLFWIGGSLAISAINLII